MLRMYVAHSSLATRVNTIAHYDSRPSCGILSPRFLTFLSKWEWNVSVTSWPH